MRTTTFEEFVELSRRGTFVPVWREIMADLLTPVSAFLKIAEHSDYAFLLESVEGGEHVGRYSFLGKDPFLILRGRGADTLIERAGVTTRADKPFVETLRELMNGFRSPFVPGLPRFTGGAVGYLGYDGNLDTAITIRSAVLKDGQAHIHTGAGIVAGSVPEREFEETEHKAAALRRAIELAAGADTATSRPTSQPEPADAAVGAPT